MRRIAALVVLVLVLSILFTRPSLCHAQGLGATLEPYLGNVVLTPSFKWGYHWTALHIDAPISAGLSPDNGAVLGIESLDASLKSSSMWVASARLAAQVGDWYVFFSAEGAVPHRVSAYFDRHPMFQLSGPDTPIVMKDSRLSWWLVEGGAGYEVRDRVVLFTGLRRDQFAAKVSKPELQGSGSLPLTQSDRLNGDLLARIWIPYVGINVSGSRFSGSLSYSPFGYSQLKLPWTHTNQPDQIAETALYSFETPGIFLEGKCDWDTSVCQRVDLGVWVKATWLHFRGNATERLNQNAGAVSGIEASGSNAASVHRYDLSLGLTASSAF